MPAKRVEDLVPGDKFYMGGKEIWTVTGVAEPFETSNGERLVSVSILWFDGGRDFRIFDAGQRVIVNIKD